MFRITFILAVTCLFAVGRDFPYSATVGSRISREDCVKDLVGNFLRRTRYHRNTQITRVTSHVFGRLLNQYGLRGETASGLALEGWAVATFERDQNALTCYFTDRNFLNAHDHRLLLSTGHSVIGAYHRRDMVLQLTAAGFVFEADR